MWNRNVRSTLWFLRYKCKSTPSLIGIVMLVITPISGIQFWGFIAQGSLTKRRYYYIFLFNAFWLRIDLIIVEENLLYSVACVRDCLFFFFSFPHIHTSPFFTLSLFSCIRISESFNCSCCNVTVWPWWCHNWHPSRLCWEGIMYFLIPDYIYAHNNPW